MLVSAAWIGPAVLGAINEVAQRYFYGGTPASAGDLLFASGDWLLYAFLTPVVFAIARRWPLERPHLRRNAVLHLAISLLFCAVWAGTGTILRAILMPQSGMTFISWLFITFPFGIAVYLAVVGIEHAIRYFADARDREVQVARLSQQLSDARFAALQAQLNPHFLFNTLNTIAVLVRDGERTAAARIVEHLSDVLRRTLNRGHTNEVALEEEIELVREYLAIEQARFSDRLRVQLDVDPSVLSAAVPSFAVQHLVENAIRHGIAKRTDAGRVMVSARRSGDMLEVSVVDDGVGISREMEIPKGHGIENTRDRLRALYGDPALSAVERRASLEVEPGTAGGTVATLRVPWRTLALESDIDAR